MHNAQADGPGSVLSFTTGDAELSRHLVEATRLFTTAVSFGAVGSSISLPYAMSHASIPEAQRREAPLPEDLMRISAGLEAPEDFLLDLGAALAGASPTRRRMYHEPRSPTRPERIALRSQPGITIPCQE